MKIIITFYDSHDILYIKIYMSKLNIYVTII